jgi:hypothetical protein
LFQQEQTYAIGPRRRGLLHLADRVRQFDPAPRANVHKPDAQKVAAVVPLQNSTKPERNTIHSEENLDRRAGARGNSLCGAHAAALLAQIGKAACQRLSRSQEEENGIFVH